MTFELVEEPQPPLKKWVDADIPGVKGTLIEGTTGADALIDFETPWGMNFIRVPIESIPKVVPALVAMYNANPPVVTTPTDPEPTDPNDPPVDIGTGDSDPDAPVDIGPGDSDPDGPVDIGTSTGEETPVDGDVLVNPIDNGNVGTEQPL